MLIPPNRRGHGRKPERGQPRRRRTHQSGNGDGQRELHAAVQQQQKDQADDGHRQQHAADEQTSSVGRVRRPALRTQCFYGQT